MKAKTWLPVPVKEPRTLADVESSREKPVLVWWNNTCVLPAYVNEHGLVKAIPKVGNQFLGGAPENHFLYSTPSPSRPTKLEDVPDGRIVRAAASSPWRCKHDARRVVVPMRGLMVYADFGGYRV